MFFKEQKYILLALGVATTLFFILAISSAPSAALEVHFLDVGQGDAIFIQTPNFTQVLIDGGYGKNVLEQLGAQMAFYDRSLDFIVATHMDKDHIGGLLDVLENFEVGAVLVSYTDADSQEAGNFFKKIKEKNIQLVEIEAPDRFRLDEDIYLDVIWPSNDFPEGLSDNEKSLVIKLVFSEDSFLLTGDMEKFAEYSLATSDVDLRSDVLKVGHHGSNSSSTNYFLDKVQASIAIIQVGRNFYGHPHEVVLERLKARRMKILRNDLNGVISIYSYGNSF